jgi:hypothetical protein
MSRFQFTEPLFPGPPTLRLRFHTPRRSDSDLLLANSMSRKLLSLRPHLIVNLQSGIGHQLFDFDMQIMNRSGSPSPQAGSRVHFLVPGGRA